MKPLIRVLTALTFVALVASACGGDDGSIDITNARYRVARADLGAGYFDISNGTGDTITLTGASAAAVGRIELHESFMNDEGAMTMEERPNGFVVEPGETVSLAPGGMHLMLFDPGVGGEDITFTLDFDGEVIDVVADFDADASANLMDMDDMDMGEMDDMDHSEMDMDDEMEMDEMESSG